MKNNKIFTIILIVVLIAVVYFLYPFGKGGSAVNSIGNMMGQNPSPTPEVSNYNPPKEVKYDSNTDLEKELDKIDPKVLNSDFDPINNL